MTSNTTSSPSQKSEELFQLFEIGMNTPQTMLSSSDFGRLACADRKTKEGVYKIFQNEEQKMAKHLGSSVDQEIDRTITGTTDKKKYKDVQEPGLLIDCFYRKAIQKQESILKTISTLPLEEIENCAIMLAKQGFIYEANQALYRGLDLVEAANLTQDFIEKKKNFSNQTIQKVFKELIQEGQLKEAIQLLLLYDGSSLYSKDLLNDLVKQKNYSSSKILQSIESATPPSLVSKSKFSIETENSLNVSSRIKKITRHFVEHISFNSELVLQANKELRKSTIAQLFILGSSPRTERDRHIENSLLEFFQQTDPLCIDFIVEIRNKVELETNNVVQPVKNERIREILSNMTLGKKENLSLTDTIDRVIASLENDRKEGDDLIIQTLTNLKYS